MAKKSVMIQCVIDGKGIGNGMNVMAAAGIIKPVYLPVGNEVLHFNCIWAMCDWKKAQGYYKDGAHLLPALGDFIAVE